MNNFWQQLKKPIIGLSPMDGVTDAAFRFITAKYGKPHVQLTEFTSAEGLQAGAVKLLEDFIYSDNERPIVGQIFGSDPKAFYKAAVLVAALGFDGLDINMGCPARNVAEHGGGASLIRTPQLAQELIRQAKRGVKDWAEGISLEQAGVHPNIIEAARSLVTAERKLIPVSVKTRVGFDAVVIEDWVKNLLQEEPTVISIHGRTLKQLYSGVADWDAIGRAASIIHQTSTLVLGNGDASSVEDAERRIKEYGVDGVLLGRATFGNPWIFQSHVPTIAERVSVAIEHASYFAKILPHKNFLHMRKHLGWYMTGFDGAKELRQHLMQPSVLGAAEVEHVLLPLLKVAV